jgi:hypothetical protein
MARLGQGRPALRRWFGRLDTGGEAAAAMVVGCAKEEIIVTTDAAPGSLAGAWARLLAVVLALHGLAQLAGTSDSLRLAGDGQAADYLGGAWTISDPAVLRALAVAWAALGIAFLALAVLVWLRPARARLPLAAAAAGSLVLGVLALPAAVVGVVIDAALLVLVWWAPAGLHGGERP